MAEEEEEREIEDLELQLTRSKQMLQLIKSENENLKLKVVVVGLGSSQPVVVVGGLGLRRQDHELWRVVLAVELAGFTSRSSGRSHRRFGPTATTLGWWRIGQELAMAEEEEREIEDLELQLTRSKQMLQLIKSENENLKLKVKHLQGDGWYIDGNFYNRVGEVMSVLKISGKERVLVNVLTPGINKQVVQIQKNADVNVKDLKPLTRVALNNTVSNITTILPNVVDANTEKMRVVEAPNTTFDMIIGLDRQIEQLKEVFVRPLEHADLYETLGVDPPKCAVLYGPPGNGKTMLARAIANHANCSFFHASATEFSSRFNGESNALVKNLFAVAREHAPSIIFIDEIDALGTSIGSSPYHALLQLMSELEVFDQTSADVKVLFATNRLQSLNKSLMAKIHRKIEIPHPSEEARLYLLKMHTSMMGNVDHGMLVKISQDSIGASSAEVKAICTEAGLFALRRRSIEVMPDDFTSAVAKVLKKAEETSSDSMKKIYI